VDLCFQNFDQELRDLPGAYALPRGTLLLAEMSGEPVGCVAIRPLDPSICELKRLYVRPGFRKTGLGRELTLAAMEAARAIGYRRVRLDSLSEMHAAQRLYQALGFYDIPSYASSPVDGTRCMEAHLD
jgi:ribosomal protein S18 acetylase RimI-like enzyme